jgi:hypothetical protein
MDRWSEARHRCWVTRCVALGLLAIAFCTQSPGVVKPPTPAAVISSADTTNSPHAQPEVSVQLQQVQGLGFFSTTADSRHLRPLNPADGVAPIMNLPAHVIYMDGKKIEDRTPAPGSFPLAWRIGVSRKENASAGQEGRCVQNATDSAFLLFALLCTILCMRPLFVLIGVLYLFFCL